MLDRNDNKITAEKLNDDGVVLLIGAIFGLYKIDERTGKGDIEHVMEYIFGGGCTIGNSHNGAYQLGLNMTRIALRRYTGKLTR